MVRTLLSGVESKGGLIYYEKILLVHVYSIDFVAKAINSVGENLGEKNMSYRLFPFYNHHSSTEITRKCFFVYNKKNRLKIIGTARFFLHLFY